MVPKTSPPPTLIICRTLLKELQNQICGKINLSLSLSLGGCQWLLQMKQASARRPTNMGVQGPNKQKNKYLRLTEQPELPELLPKCSIVFFFSLSLSLSRIWWRSYDHAPALPCPCSVARLRICSRTFLVREGKGGS